MLELFHTLLIVDVTNKIKQNDRQQTKKTLFHSEIKNHRIATDI